jgi:hypothetical protein
VISRTVRQFGIAGCLSRMARETGDHPEAAASRMRWIGQLVGGASEPRPASAILVGTSTLTFACYPLVRMHQLSSLLMSQTAGVASSRD